MAKQLNWKWNKKTVVEHSMNNASGYFEIREERDGNNEYTLYKDQTCLACNEDLNKLKEFCETYLEINGYLPND